MTAIRDALGFAQAASRYWPRRVSWVAGRLDPDHAAPIAPGPLPPRMIEIAVPEWAEAPGGDGRLLAPSHLVPDPRWPSVDWVSVGLWYLDCLAEREHERRHGSVHSYAARLSGWDDRIWARAWVNRIAILLRNRLAREEGRTADELFGPLPPPEFDLSHDVDALRRHGSLRLKQAAFWTCNSLRETARGRVDRAFGQAARAVRFLVGDARYDMLDEMMDSEERLGRRSVFHVFPGPPRCRLLDPRYDPSAVEVADRLRHVVDRGWEIGLHPGFRDHASADSLRRGLEILESIVGTRPRRVRQHWLRFSFDATWSAQQQAGLELDGTLGFNDRPGFRAGAALRFHPWIDGRRSTRLESMPLVLMDSHVHDYGLFDEDSRPREVDRWMLEVEAVRGEAGLDWHQRVLHPDYGWGSSWNRVLTRLGQVTSGSIDAAPRSGRSRSARNEP